MFFLWPLSCSILLSEIENEKCILHCEKRMMVPFMRIGELITGGDHFVFTPAGLWEVLKGRHSRELMFGVLHAVSETLNTKP